jgi:hypothetical protein
MAGVDASTAIVGLGAAIVPFISWMFLGLRDFQSKRKFKHAGKEIEKWMKEVRKDELVSLHDDKLNQRIKEVFSERNRSLLQLIQVCDEWAPSPFTLQLTSTSITALIAGVLAAVDFSPNGALLGLKALEWPVEMIIAIAAWLAPSAVKDLQTANANADQSQWRNLAVFNELKSYFERYYFHQISSAIVPILKEQVRNHSKVFSNAQGGLPEDGEIARDAAQVLARLDKLELSPKSNADHIEQAGKNLKSLNDI